MNMKPLTGTQIERRESEDGAFLYVKLLPRDGLPAEIAAQVGDGVAVEAQVGLRQDLTVEFQQALINTARAILNDMEAALAGGEGAVPGKKAVKA